MKSIAYARLSTEQSNPRSRHLDQLSSKDIVHLMNQEDRRILQAIAQESKAIAQAIKYIRDALRGGGRLFLIGAGTSGRLAVLEAAECPPTFNASPQKVQAIMAGGKMAVFRSKEGAEDSEQDARKAISARIHASDVVVGIAASGVTPFVRAALHSASMRKARTILLTCNRQGVQKPKVDVWISLNVGPEVLTGSTRLKAGTACKMVLNMLTTGSFVQIGKAYGNWMVDLQPKSRKLVARGTRLIQRLGQVSEKEAQRLFKAAQGRVKPAIVMARRHVSAQEAEQLLREAEGFLRKVIE